MRSLLQLVTPCLLATSPVAFAQTTKWQVNQSGASLYVDAFKTNDPFKGPIIAPLVSGTSHDLYVDGNHGRPFTVFFGPAPGVSRQWVSPGGQILNIPWPFFPGFGGVIPKSAPLRLRFAMPKGLRATMQMLVFEPTHRDRFLLSALTELRSVPVDIYIDSDSTASSELGTRAAPFKTIARALAHARAGQTLHIDWAKTPYTENLSIAVDDLRLIGDNWNDASKPRPVLRSRTGPRAGYTLNVLAGRRRVRIERLEVQPGTFAAKRYSGVSWGGCINLWDRASDVLIRDCVLRGRNPATREATFGIVSESANERIMIEHCLFERLEHGYLLEPVNVIPIGLYGSKQVTIRNCRFTRLAELQGRVTDYSHLQLIYLSKCQDVSIHNNLWHDNTAPSATGCTWYFVNCLPTSERVHIVNNTMANIDIRRVRAPLVANLRGFKIHKAMRSATLSNNIVAKISWTSGALSVPIGVFGNSTGTIRLRYSCVDKSWPRRVVPANFEDTTTCIAVDPQFLAPGSQNYRLRASSPCKGTGDPAYKNHNSNKSDMGCYGGPRGHLRVGNL